MIQWNLPFSASYFFQLSSILFIGIYYFGKCPKYNLIFCHFFRFGSREKEEREEVKIDSGLVLGLVVSADPDLVRDDTSFLFSVKKDVD